MPEPLKASGSYVAVPHDRASAGALLARGIRSGLVPFHPEVRIGQNEDDPGLAMPYGGGHGFYFICCLELFNHMAENATYKVCANDACGRLFVRQEGRAVHGQHRTRGIKYCSSECARAQAQRAYRRRKRADGTQPE